MDEKSTDSTQSPLRFVSQLPGKLASDVWRSRLLVMFVAACVFLPMLGSFGLWDPWETHYGEVGRQITERNDWISTWWGAHWQDAGGSQEGTYFFSKPILLMWLMAIGLKIFGVGEFAIRIGVCVIAILGLGTIYSLGREVWSKRVGVLMAALLGTAPFYFFLGRQAQTDMPFVGLLTIAMAFFMMGAFGKSRNEPADRLSYGLTLGWAGALIVPQVSLLLVGLSRWRGGTSALGSWISTKPGVGIGAVSGLMGIAALILGVAMWKRRGQVTHEAMEGADSIWLRWRLRKFGLISLGVLWVPLLAMLVGTLVTGTGAHVARNLNGWFVWSGTQAALYLTCFGFALYWTFGHPDLRRKRLHFFGFYLFVGLATLAKGLLGFMLPGAIFFLYLLVTREWKLLKEVELLPGIPIFIAVTFPWYAAMLIRHPHAFWERFFVHDHFKRLSSGVHQVDEGSFEHFARWLGYGFFPWSAFVPAALSRFFTKPSLTKMEDESDKATVMVLLWLVVAFTLFTLSSTKFHHYIFPALPPLALLTALALDDVLEDERPALWPLYLVGLGIIGALAWDIIDDPQVLKNLFTYKYDRTWDNPDWDRTFRWTLGVVSTVAMVGASMVLWKTKKVRQWGVGVIFLAGVVLAYFSLDYYMPIISKTWSQRELWESYYTQCDREEAPPGGDKRKRYCAQPVIAYKLNWRGETYYSQNEVIPIRDDDDFTHFLSQSGDEPFFAIMEMARYKGEFNRRLPAKLRGKACITYSENPKFLLAKIPCAPDDPDRKEAKK